MTHAARDGASAGDEQHEGVEVVPGVRFSDKLWSRLGGKAHEMERQKRRERMSDTAVVPDQPTAIFDHAFRNDSIWKQRCVDLSWRGPMRGQVDISMSASTSKPTW